MRIFSYLVFFIILLIGITFAYLNASLVDFNYYFGTKTMPLSLLLIFAFGFGILITFLFIAINWIRLTSQNFRLKKRIQNLEHEFVNLKNIPK